MKRLLSHIKRLFRKFWFFLFIAFCLSPILGLGVLIIAIGLSITLFSDPIDAKDPTDYFTKDELRKIQSDEEIDNEEYLILLAKVLSYECPVKVDPITTWTSSEVTKDSFIYNYVINDKGHRYNEFNTNVVKSRILNTIDEDQQIKRILATNRNIIYRYWNQQTKTFGEIVLSIDEIKKEINKNKK